MSIIHALQGRCRRVRSAVHIRREDARRDHPSVTPATRGMVEALERRRLLSGSLPTSVHASPDAQYTILATGTAGAPAWSVTLTAGTFSFDANVGAAGGDWQNLTLTVTGSALVTFKARLTLYGLTLSGSAKAVAASSGGGAGGNLLIIGPGGLTMPEDPAFQYPTATLDLTDNDLILQGGGAAGLAHAFALLRNGSRGGWTGKGVTSSDAAATGTGVGAAALGVALNDPAGAAVHFTRFDGVEVGDSDVLVKYTLAGDADLSGNVNDADYQILSAHYAQTGASWAAGDFTFDTQIRGDDYQRLSDNMGQELTGPLAPHDIAAFAVPIHAVEAQPYGGAVVQFYDSLNTPGNPAPTTASSYQAFISWGDGNFLPAKVSDDGLGDGGFVAAATAPFVLRNPDALISTRVEYSQSSHLQGLPPTLATPQLSIIPAVAGLLAFTASTSEIDLRWTLNATKASAIEVDRSLDGITFAPLTTLSGTATTYQDTAADIGQHYFYEVRAIQPAGPSPFSNVTDGYAVSAISDLTAVAASNSEIDLSWASNTSDATKFEIDRSTDGANYTLLATTTDTTFNNTGLPEGTHYWYQVRAIRPGGLSAPCIPADTYTFPNSPTLVAVSAGTGNGAEADLRWIDHSSMSPGFNIERSQDGSFWEGADSTDPGVTTDSDLGVADGTHYSYRVRAYNEGGESDPSNVLDVFIPLTPPSLLVASAASASQINLTWENDSLSATGFSLQRSTDGKTYEQIATIGDPNTTTFSDAGLSPNTRYYYRIVATTASLTSATSEVASGATLS